MEYNKVYAIDVSALSGVLQKIQSHEKEDDSTSFWVTSASHDYHMICTFIGCNKHIIIYRGNSWPKI
jgi:hypothetical protein